MDLEMETGEEFEPIGQTSEDLEIDLTAGDTLMSVVDVRDEPGFKYPAMLISGIRFNDTLRILQAVRKESYRLFDVWLDLGDGSPPTRQGTLQADSQVLLTMRYLGLTVTLYLTEDSVQTLDLRDPSVIENYI